MDSAVEDECVTVDETVLPLKVSENTGYNHLYLVFCL